MTSSTARTVLGTCAAVGLTLSLSGCSLFGGSSSSASGAGAPTSLPVGSPKAGASLAASPGATPSAGSSSLPSLRPKPGAGKSPCDAPTMTKHLALASGAVHTYLAKPGTNGATVIALKNAETKAVGAKAASLGANELIKATTVVSGCATTPALSSVIRQTSSYLVKLSTSLKGNAATSQGVSAAEALIGDVNAQASRLGITIVDVAPTKAQLG